MSLINETAEDYYEGNNHGNYQFVTLKNIVNNFRNSFVGQDKLISRMNRTDIVFHAKRAIQEFSYDVFKSYKSQEIEIKENLQMPLPQDYVNYVKVCYINDNGVEKILYPTRVTSNPTSILQDDEGNYLYDDEGNLLYASGSQAWERFKGTRTSASNDEDYTNLYQDVFSHARYGLDPEFAQSNGVYHIDNVAGKIFFESSVAGKIIVLHYISDGLGSSEDMIVHKLAEKAVYMDMAYSILSSRSNVQEYIINRYKRLRRAEINNAKIRLSNLKLGEAIQLMRGKSKQIKH